MTLPTFSANLNHFNRLRARNARRDSNHHIIHEVRQGNIRSLFPSELNFSITFQGSPISNFIDVVARDMAEGLAPLPALACTSGKMRTDADQRRAEIKNRIGDNYWAHSKLARQMLRGADRFVTYGFLPAMIEPDIDNRMPFIQLFDPRHSYYELDRFGRTIVFAHRWLRSIDELCAMFPEKTNVIVANPENKTKQYPDGKPDSGDTELEMVLWVDKTNVTLFLPSRQGLVLDSYAHKLSRNPVVIAERPGEGEYPRGQFDDVVWTQVARSIMSTLALEAASLAVQAPIAVPDDMDELSIGPHAIMQTSQPQNVRRINIDINPQIFAENQVLDQELKQGSRYPDARTGGVQASVITGKGVEALLGTFDSQIKGGQIILGSWQEEFTSIAFEMDEVWWPNESKTISGTVSGKSWELTYTPSTDISGRYACRVSYGFAAGMQPSQSVVTMLQLLGSGVIAKETFQDNMPFDVDHIAEQRNIEVERTRDAIQQGLFAYVQSAGQLAASGQDPTPILQMAAQVVRDIQNGTTVEDAVSNAFAQQEAAKQQQMQQQMEQQAAAGGGAPDMGGGDNGLPPGVAPGQAGQPPGGLPTIQNLIAGFRGNATLPVNQATIQRRVPTGT